MSDFADSPRASKRRRTATYSSDHSILQEQQNANSPAPGSDKRRKTTSNLRTESSPDGSKVQSVGRAKRGHGNSMIPAIQGGKITRGTRRRSREADDKPDTVDALSAVLTPTEEQEIPSGQLAYNDSATDHYTPPLEHDETVAESDQEDTTPQPRSSGRQRSRPRRYSISPEKPKSKPPIPKASTASKKRATTTLENDSSPIKAMPRGILTPSKNRVVRPKKSVVFDNEEKDIEERFGFKDIDSSTPASAASKSQAKQSPVRKKRKSSETTLTENSSVAASQDHSETIVVDDIVNDTIADELDLDQIVIPAPSLDPTNDPESLSSSTFSSPSLLRIKSEILARLNGTSISTAENPIPTHHQQNYNTIHSLLTATITSGESNSLLLLGSRGSGKSHILSLALQNLDSSHGEDFHTVRLNGFFQTDDKLALREIWRQLGREMNVDEKETSGVAGSYADTMSSLLSLLSHPDEFAPVITTDGAEMTAAAIDPDLMDTDVASHSQSTTAAPVIQSRSVVFIIDEFDLFTTHPRQTLLYNLFDIAQSRKAPIAVIGCSTRMDVVECLEKRVKSRFSHRWIHVQGPKSLRAFTEVLVGGDVEAREDVGGVLCCNENTDDNYETGDNGEDQEVRRRWNEYMKTTFILSPTVQDIIERSFYTTKSLPGLFMALYAPIATLQLPFAAPSSHSTDTTQTTSSLSTVTPSTSHPPSVLTLLPILPTLHLSLLIAASRLDTIHNLPALNFSLAYDQYRDLVTRTKLQHSAGGAVALGGGAGFRLWSREMARSAWEALGRWELLVPVSGGDRENDALGGEGANVRMWRVDVTLEDLSWALKRENREDGGGAGGGLEVLQKWCREV